MTKAYWILKDSYRRPDEYTCSRCRSISRRPTRFCAQCGSRMRFVEDVEEEWEVFMDEEMDEMDEEDGLL
jgi:RNA polymerase subunit RPABC4/transcription elongation factor Spt4